MTTLQKMNDFRNHFAILHDVGVGDMKNAVILDAGTLGTGNGYLPIVLAWNQQTVDPVDGPISCDHTTFKMNLSQSTRRGIQFCVQLPSRRAIDPSKKSPGSDLVHYFTSLIGRSQHHDSSQATVFSL